MKNIKAAIFDLDGTLLDSMWVWEKIDHEYLTQKGHTVPSNLKNDITHLSYPETALYFKNRFFLEDSIEMIMQTWHTMAFNYYSNLLKLKPGVLEYLNKLKNSNIKIALATSSSYALLEAALKNNNIFDLFDCITTTDEVNKSKNNPDIYLLAAKKLNVNPCECIVFEDIIEAVKGAKLAGMKVIAVQDNASLNEKETLIELADKYIVDFNDLL